MTLGLAVLLALVTGLAGLAGCGEYHEGSIILEPTDEERLVNEIGYSPLAVDFGNPHELEAVLVAIADGRATFNALNPPRRYYEASPVSLGDSYDDVSFEAVSEWDGYEIAAKLDYNASALVHELRDHFLDLRLLGGRAEVHGSGLDG